MANPNPTPTGGLPPVPTPVVPPTQPAKPAKQPPPEVAYPILRKQPEVHKKNDGVTDLTHDDEKVLGIKLVRDTGIKGAGGKCVAGTLLAMFVLIFGLCWAKTGSVKFSLEVFCIVTAVVVVYQKDRVFTDVPTQRGEKWLNNFSSGPIVIYTQGWHLVPWWYSRDEGDLIDFQKHEPVCGKVQDNTHVEFQTNNGYTMIAEFSEFWQNREEEGALGHRLRYKNPELNALIRATLKSYISDLGGLNSYETITYYKAEIANWLAGVFGGIGFISEFEESTGIRLLNPILDTLDLDAASKKLYLDKAKAKILSDSAVDMATANKNTDPEILRMAQAAAGLLKRTENTTVIRFEGTVPPSLHTVAVGGAAVAVGGGNDDKKGKGGK